MGTKDLKEGESERYFPSVEQPSPVADEGTKEMFPLYPFIVSGGKNTERYYFTHVSDVSDIYKFNIRPQYFGDESAYTEKFPLWIKGILSKNTDAKVFCVFDMDTVVNEKLINKHNSFVSMFQSEIDSGQVVLCDSMPSFEFWLLLHFADYKGLLKTYPQVSQVLAPYLKPYFDDNSKPFKKLIKAEKHLKKSDWVRRMLDENRLSQAVERAKVCLLRECEEPGKHSYTNVYKVFETNEG